MKISKINNKLRYLGIVVLCYMVASWGVNGVINPVHYLANTNMQILQTEEDDEYLYIDLPQDPSDIYVVFEISNMNTIMNNIDIIFSGDEGARENQKLRIYQGFVSYKIDFDVSNIKISKKDIQNNELTINQVWISDHKKMDIPGMLKIFVSFILGAALWEGSQKLKKKYA